MNLNPLKNNEEVIKLDNAITFFIEEEGITWVDTFHKIEAIEFELKYADLRAVAFKGYKLSIINLIHNITNLFMNLRISPLYLGKMEFFYQKEHQKSWNKIEFESHNLNENMAASIFRRIKAKAQHIEVRYD